MDDDDTFRRLMESAGVVPLESDRPPAEPGKRRPAGGRRRDPAAESSDDADRELFEAAMRDLDTVPLAEPPADDSGAGRARRSPRRIRPRKKDLRVDDRVDLHRCTSEQATKRLQHALRAAARSGSRTLLVITGKGHHSPGGVPVLRRQVEEWIRRRGRRHRVDAYSEAPRALGGRGAFVLYLGSG